MTKLDNKIMKHTNTIKVNLLNGDSFTTSINLDEKGAVEYYLGKDWNMGTEGDNFQKCISVEINGQVIKYDYKNHKYYDAAYRAHYNTSFSPEKRATAFCHGFDVDIAKLNKLEVPAHKINKYEQLMLEWLSAKSRCLSSMITGPANFPVARNEKANASEHKKSVASSDYYNKIVDEAKKEAFYKEHPEARPIMSNDPQALEKLEAKLEKLEASQARMVAINKLVRKKPIDMEAVIKLAGSEDAAKTMLEPDYMGRIGFASYCLSNNRGAINQVKERIAAINNQKNKKEPKDFMVGSVRVLENTEIMRLQIFFDGKPDSNTRAILKSKGFRWAPSQNAWQRQLTNNAIYAFNHYILSELKKLEA